MAVQCQRRVHIRNRRHIGAIDYRVRVGSQGCAGSTAYSGSTYCQISEALALVLTRKIHLFQLKEEARTTIVLIGEIDIIEGWK